jgi:hypothetical protein
MNTQEEITAQLDADVLEMLAEIGEADRAALVSLSVRRFFYQAEAPVPPSE